MESDMEVLTDFGDLDGLGILFQELEQSIQPGTTSEEQQVFDDQDLLTTLMNIPSEALAETIDCSGLDYQTQLKELGDLLKENGDKACPLIYDDALTLRSVEGPQPNQEVTSTSIIVEGNIDKICKVCGNVAGKHSYYGGQVCNSCRAFFRRSVVNESFDSFKCLENKNCTINSKSRKSCQYCRYQLCQKAGMKPKWILSETEINKRKRNGKQKDAAVVHEFKSELALQDKFGPDEMMNIQDRVNKVKEYTQNQWVRFYAKHKDYYTNSLRSTYHGDSMTFESLKKLEKFVHNICLGYYIDLVDGKPVSLDDARDLITGNTVLITTIAQSLYHNPQDVLQMKTQIFNLIEDNGSQDGVYLQEQKRIISHNGTLSPKGIHYSQVFVSPWAPTKALEDLHFKLTLKISQWMPRTHQKHPKDDVAFYLLLIIALFSSDFIELHKPKDVEEIQRQYLVMFYRYLKFQYGQRGLSLFADGLLMMSYARQAFEIRMQHLPL
ncbi:hypothetical protein TCAL_13234 [Tigriopus californicus]|uniref:Nuclear receptor domain-containing protein n=1 Tax=Tigriopus californicus TaxID=6832 RepID=A0A553NR01_TIGCA|nr:hypothetical protein TCAL_13234 [Tigriopus californicus]